MKKGREKGGKEEKKEKSDNFFLNFWLARIYTFTIYAFNKYSLEMIVVYGDELSRPNKNKDLKNGECM